MKRSKTIKLHLKKRELESIYDLIVNPFYTQIQNDNETKALIDPVRLPGLKIKQTLFIFRFFTTDIDRLKTFIPRLNKAHSELDISVETMTAYYFFWSSLIQNWLQNLKGVDKADLEQWVEKVYILFGSIMESYDMRRIHPAAVEKEAARAPESKLADMVREVHAAQVNKSISAKTFLDGIEYDRDLIDELEELEEDAVATLFDLNIIDRAQLNEVQKIFATYAKLLENTYEFKELAFALGSLNALLEAIDPANMEKKKMSKVVIYLNGILGDIGTWRKSVFVTQESIDVHYLDASLFSSIAQLDILLSQQQGADETEDDNDLELF